MSETRATPDYILLDAPGDGYCENYGWVTADVTEDEARDALTEFCCDDNGNMPARPAGPASRVYLRLKNPAAYYEDQRWVLCKPGAKTAVEFWQIDVTEVVPDDPA